MAASSVVGFPVEGGENRSCLEDNSVTIQDWLDWLEDQDERKQLPRSEDIGIEVLQGSDDESDSDVDPPVKDWYFSVRPEAAAQYKRLLKKACLTPQGEQVTETDTWQTLTYFLGKDSVARLTCVNRLTRNQVQRFHWLWRHFRNTSNTRVNNRRQVDYLLRSLFAQQQ